LIKKIIYFTQNLNSNLTEINIQEDISYFYETFKTNPEYDPKSLKCRFKKEEFITFEDDSKYY